MPDILSVHAAAQPDKVALIEGRRRVTYAELEERARRAAWMFGRLGAAEGHRVAILAANSVTGFEVAGGLRKIGAIGVPVNFRLRGEEIAYIVNDSGASAVCAGEEYVEHVEAARPGFSADPAPRLVALGPMAPPGWLRYEELMAPQPPGQPEGPDGLATGASMIYTSGTTGKPKGASRPQGAPLEDILGQIALFDLRPDDVHLFAGPGYHSAPIYFNALHLALGATVVIMPRFDPVEALALIEAHRVTTTFMAPVLLHRIMEIPGPVLDRYDVGSLRALILGGAPCPISLKERAAAYFGTVLWEFYGATETSINLVLRPEEQLAKPGSCGRPTPGSDVRLLDPLGQEVEEGEPGELWVRSGSLATYHNRPDATAASMRDGFFSVGDIAYRDADGFYFICDRKVDMIISGGANVYPAEVEACLHGHPAVRDVAVIGVPDDAWGEAVKAVVVLRPGYEATAVLERELIGWARGRIADYKCPRSVDFAAELPRDQAGKLLKRRLREPYWEGSGRRI